MHDRRRSVTLIGLMAVAVISAAVLGLGVADSLLNGASSPWLIIAAVTLVASLTFLAPLRRTRRD
ncbi:hypothetical protein [Frondihabitans cladoniiphilus]|uniref:MYXO-CTERM domain-containing protein n=1 Tax=Frondihabitans cladoniiphilus TaxID=715785 RepID=A0ABP8W5T6_9MICO